MEFRDLTDEELSESIRLAEAERMSRRMMKAMDGQIVMMVARAPGKTSAFEMREGHIDVLMGMDVMMGMDFGMGPDRGVTATLSNFHDQIRDCKKITIDEDEDDKPSRNSTPMFGKDPNKVFGNKKKKGRF